MSVFPGDIFSWRTFVNRAGAVFNAAKTTIPYAEDLNAIVGEIVALEENLQDKVDRLIQIVGVSRDTLVPASDHIVDFIVPAGLNGYKIIGAHCGANVADDVSNMIFDVFNSRLSHSIFSTKMRIDLHDLTSYSSDSQPVIDSDYNALQTADVLSIISESAASTMKGLQVFLTVQKVV